MLNTLADLTFTFYSCDMRKRNSFHISKENFLANKKAFKTIVGERRFEILELNCEKEMTYQQIAEMYGISATRINQIIAHSCYLIQKAGYEIDRSLKKV